MKYAVIDIGSNSVRLMLWAGGKTLYKKLNTTRLGEGLAVTGRLSEAAIARTAEAVRIFAEEGSACGAQVLAFATAAVRRSSNGQAFVSAVKTLCGVDVDVVSGEDEAMLAVLGALGAQDGGIVDIGGASTELCLRSGGKTVFSVSLDVGAVRLFDRCKDDRALLEGEIADVLSALPAMQPQSRMDAVGGTATTLAALLLGLEEYDGQKITGFPLRIGEISALTDKLFASTVAERRALAGMDPCRADIIAGGALLLFEIMKKWSLSEVYASDRDNLEGYLALKGLA